VAAKNIGIEGRLADQLVPGKACKLFGGLVPERDPIFRVRYENAVADLVEKLWKGDPGEDGIHCTLSSFL
jgi:hypothetical protein